MNLKEVAEQQPVNLVSALYVGPWRLQTQEKEEGSTSLSSSHLQPEPVDRRARYHKTDILKKAKKILFNRRYSTLGPADDQA